MIRPEMHSKCWILLLALIVHSVQSWSTTTMFPSSTLVDYSMQNKSK